MSDDALRAVVLDCLKAVAPEADTAHLDMHRSFHDQLDIDSIDYLNYILAIEERLGMRIAETDYPRLSSLEGALAYLEDRRRRDGGTG